MTRHLSTCPLCEASCGLLIETDGKTVSAIRGDPDDPLSHGHICPKAVALKDLHDDPDRLRIPLLREGNKHRELGWDEALDLAARRLLQVRKNHGREALALYLGNPVIHNLGAMALSPLLSKALNTPNRFSATSVDQLPQMVAALKMFGHQLLVPVPDLERTDLLVLFGANPAASNGSLMTAGGITDRLDKIAARGRVVLFDPRRTESARHAEHHFIRPGTDALALLALLNVLFTEGLANPGKTRSYLRGLDTLESIARRFPPEHVAARTGIPADTIRGLARDLARTRAAVYGRMGVSTQTHGTLAAWLVFAINIVTGNLDVPGGVMFPTPAIDGVSMSALLPRATFGRRHSRVRHLPEFSGEYPIATLADEILTPGPGQVRALVTVAGNPALSTPNGKRLAHALTGLDFYVAIDPYLNESTRHAHLILPPASPLERPHYDLALYHFAVHNVARYTRPVFERPAECRHDWEIMAGLARRLNTGMNLRSLGQRLTISAIERFGLERVIDLALRTGPRRLSLKRVLANPHGLDLGPLQETLPGRLQTDDKTIDLAPTPFVDAIPELVRDLSEPFTTTGSAGTTLELIGRRHLRSNNSWLHNSARLMKGKNRCTLMMNPGDATTRGLAHGQQVEVHNHIGRVQVELEVTDTIMAGVVSLPHGFGHTTASRLNVAMSMAGVSHNDLTDQTRLDHISGNAAFSGTPVEVSGATP